MKSNNLGKLPLWNLKDLYKSSKDPKISLDLLSIEKKSKNFEKNMKKMLQNLAPLIFTKQSMN